MRGMDNKKRDSKRDTDSMLSATANETATKKMRKTVLEWPA